MPTLTLNQLSAGLNAKHLEYVIPFKKKKRSNCLISVNGCRLVESNINWNWHPLFWTPGETEQNGFQRGVLNTAQFERRRRAKDRREEKFNLSLFSGHLPRLRLPIASSVLTILWCIAEGLTCSSVQEKVFERREFKRQMSPRTRPRWEMIT